MAQADIEMWVDNVKDVIDDRSELTAADQLAALRELIEYLETVSIPDAEALRPAKRKRKRNARAK